MLNKINAPFKGYCVGAQIKEIDLSERACLNEYLYAIS
jgi:hypothetical protein